MRKSPKRSKRRKKDSEASLAVFMGRGRSMLSSFIRIIALIIGILALGIFAWLGSRLITRAFFSNNNIFALTNLQIKCNGPVIKERHIIDYLELSSCSNVFNIDITAQRKRLLESAPRIKQVNLSRKLPGTLQVNITERIPVAKLNMGRFFLTVDETGYVLGPSGGLQRLPVINAHGMSGLRPGVQLTETSIITALELLDVCADESVGRSMQIAVFDVHEPDSLDLWLMSGEHVKLAWKDMRSRTPDSRKYLIDKLNKLVDVLRQSEVAGRQVEYVDMRGENNFPVTYKELK